MPSHALSPIVLFAYNRPEHTRQALETLTLNSEARDSELIIYLDVPPNGCSDAVSSAQHRTRGVLEERAWCGHVEIIEASAHMGCDASMRRGITEVVSAYRRAIIIEDDLIFNSHFLGFVNRGLSRYSEDERVGAISGYMYPVNHVRLPETFFNCLLNFWGWGTWQRAWSRFQPDAAVLIAALETRRLMERFKLGRREYHDYLLALQGRLDSYDILWYATLLTRGMLVLYPGLSHLRNQGFDRSGTHLSIMDRPNLAFQQQVIAADPVDGFPDSIEEDLYVTEAVIAANAYIWPARADAVGKERSA